MTGRATEGDFHLENDNEKRMLRRDGDHSLWFVKRYGTEEELGEINDFVNDIMAGAHHRVIPAERYWMDRTFDGRYGSGEIPAVIDSALAPIDLLDFPRFDGTDPETRHARMFWPFDPDRHQHFPGHDRRHDRPPSRPKRAPPHRWTPRLE